MQLSPATLAQKEKIEGHYVNHTEVRARLYVRTCEYILRENNPNATCMYTVCIRYLTVLLAMCISVSKFVST